MNDISRLTQYGDFYRLRISLHKSVKDDLNKFDNQWSQYNPRKPYIQRQGLCVINEKGSCGPGPALDSLIEYNKENNLKLSDHDFNKPTELYYSSNALQHMFKDNLSWCIRTHFIKLKPGGFFPPHRDHSYKGIQDSFRLVVPIENCNPPDSYFIVEDKILYWEYFTLYFVNTLKTHTLFNAHPINNSIWLVINAKLCNESINFVEKYL